MLYPIELRVRETVARARMPAGGLWSAACASANELPERGARRLTERGIILESREKSSKRMPGELYAFYFAKEDARNGLVGGECNVLTEAVGRERLSPAGGSDHADDVRAGGQAR